MPTSPITALPTFGEGDAFGEGFGLGNATAPIKGSYLGVGVAKGIGNRTPRSTFRENAADIDKPAKKLTIRDSAAVAIIDARFFTLAHPTGQSCVRMVPSGRR